MTNITLNLGSDYVKFNYSCEGLLQLQSNTNRCFKSIPIEELDVMITWLVGVRQNMEKVQKEVKE